VCCLGLCGVARPATGPTHPFSVHDMLAMDRITDPQVSPDGQSVAFVVRRTDLDADRGRTDLWIASTDGTGLRQLTSDPEPDSNPRWSPDGRTIWFLSGRSGSSQAWKMPAAGGKAEQMTKEPLDVGNLLISRDGTHLAYTMEVFPDAKTPQDTKDRLDQREKNKATGRIYESLFVRHWDVWEDGRRSHLFVRPAAGGEAVDVMRGMDADTPSLPFGGPEEIAFTPDSKGIVFAAKDVGRAEAWSTDFDLYWAPVDGSAPPQCLTEDNEAWDTCPAFSPDGKTLAYLAMSRPGYESDQFRIMLMNWPTAVARSGPETRKNRFGNPMSAAGKEAGNTSGGRSATRLAPQWDRSPSAIGWSADGRSLYAIAGNTGQESLFALDVRSGFARTLVKEGTVHAFSVARDGIVYSLSDMHSPAELYCVRPRERQPQARPVGSDAVKRSPSVPSRARYESEPSASTLPRDGNVRQLTHINAEKVAAARMGDYEQFSFLGWNDETVFGYIVKPVDFDPGRKYPVAFLIHGGPQGSFGNVFHYRWNPQAYAGAGYAVVMVDFHGSTGYGQAFCDSIRGDWGGKPLVDLQKGLAAALDRDPWMDSDRVGALGASFGGYMINWIAGQWPDRFRCLVNHDGDLDERMAYFDTEELWFPEWDHRGTPWDNPGGYEDQNPVRFVGRWKTPMLVIHGGQDFRVALTQGLGTFNALQRRGIPSKFLYFPDEGHWVLKPHNSILWHDTVIAWLDQWLK
jgi:dipeptidyl aminopeptidase/acylaminoacyl peptidase